MAKSHNENRGAEASNTRWRWFPVASCVIAMFAFAGVGQARSEASVPPPDATTMTGAELFMLYRNKSWLWSDGAGRMESDSRRFTAWAGSGDSATWAEGRWIVTDRGRLCFKAEWHSLSGVHPAKTCFSHKRHRNTIYQRREPSQAWYVFKHADSVEGEEFGKLVSQDLVSSELETIRSAIPNVKSNRRTQ
jgi:Protein of unknown function (DUF995)